MSASTSTPQTQYRQARQSLAMVGLAGLPSNDILHTLPPLPETPSHLRRIDDIPEGIVTSHVQRIKIAPATERRPREERTGEDVFSAIPQGGVRRTQSYRDTLSVAYPTLSTRQSGVNPIPPRSPSMFTHPTSTPTDITFAAEEAHSQQPQPTSPRRQSASFQLPSTVVDASLIADCSLMGGAASSNGDADFSVDMGIDQIRPPVALPRPTSLNYNNAVEYEDGSTTPTKLTSQSQSLRSPPGHALDQSTLLPSSPARSVHLLASTNALNRTEPPWSASDSADESTLLSPPKLLSSPRKASAAMTASLPRSQTLKSFPTASSNSKRTFPASSSGQSLASVGEEPEHHPPARPFDPEMSTLLPVSPEKARYLLSDDDMIAKETLFEMPSFGMALGRPAAQTLPLPRSSPRHSPVKMTPAKSMRSGATPRSARRGTDLQADMTLDVKDLMAKVSKPKRASGTEESFVDLLHGEQALDGMDCSMLGPDESIFPAGLRSMRRKQPSPVKYSSSPDSASTSGRTVTQGEHTLPAARLDFPTAKSTRALPLPRDSADLETRQTNLARSKSLSKVAEILNRVRADHLPASPMKSANQAEPPKTVAVARIRPSAITPGLARPRASIAPRTTTSRRVSLSTGALPIVSSASLQTVDLPPARPTHARTTSSTAPAASTLASSTSSTRRVPTSSISTGPATAATTARNTISRTARPSAAPAPASTSMAQKSRLGSSTGSSTTSTVSARVSSKPEATNTARSTATASSATSATRTARATMTRPAGLPQPGNGPTARSAPTSTVASARAPRPSTATAVTATTTSKLSRGFGTDASTTTNRLPRPSVVRPAVGSKLSIGPGVSPTKRESTTSTAATGAGATTKSRAMSTPASALVRARQSTLSSATTSAAARRPDLAKKSSIPPLPTTLRSRTEVTGSTRSIATGTTRSTTGLPSSSSSASRSLAVAASGQGLAGIRGRLDQLQARQGRMAL